MGLRYEAWTLPWLGDFKRKIATLPVLPGTGVGDIRLFSTGGEGSCEVSLAQFDRIGEVVGPTVGSLIRVYDGSTIIHEWECSRTPKDLTSVSRVAPLSGPSISAYFDKCLIYAREYPNLVTDIQDHIWAGDNVLDNPGMEEAQEINERYEVWADATGGTFTLTVMGQTTAAIDWNASVLQMEERLQDLSNVDDVLVTAGDTDPGTEDNPWQIEFLVPAIVTPDMSVDDTLLTGLTGQVTITTIQDGKDDVPLHWTESQYADRRQDPKFHGRYASDGFRRDNTVAHSGTYSIRINGLARYAGAQQVVRVEPGMTYQASIWVYTTDATEVFKFIARSAYVDGEAPGLAQDGGSIPASTWTQFNFEVTVPQNVDTLIFRIAAVGNSNPIPFWIDDAELLEGFAAATPGVIIPYLLDDMVLNHVADPRGAILDWVDYSSITATLDSGGNAWDGVMSFTAQYGESFGQVLDKMVNRGIEWDLVPKATPVGTLTHDFFLYKKGGRDSSPSTAITIRQGVTGGEVIDRIPDYTALLIEGTDTYLEVEDASAANFGRKEKFLPARDTADIDTLQLLADEAFAAEATNRRAAQFNVVETLYHPRPGINYRPGDTIPMQAPPGLAREYRRVVTYDYANTFPTSYSVTGSRVMGGEAAAFELVRRLWRRFKRPEIPRRRGAVTGAGLGSGGAPTVVVAAANATELSKAKADYVCTGGIGNNVDHLTIMEAIAQLEAAQGGRLLLTEGSYFCEFGGLAWGTDRVTVQGMGPHATELNFFGGSGPAIDITNAQYNCLRDFAINGPGSGTDVGIYANSHALRIQNVFLQSLGGVAIHLDTATTSVNSSWVESCWLDDNGDIGILVDGSTRLRIIGNEITRQVGHCISIIGGSTEIIVAENTLDATEDTGNGINVDGLTASQIVHNIVTASGHGISLNDSSGNDVANNQIKSALFNTHNTFDGILVQGNSDENFITNNRTIGNSVSPQPRYAINIAAATCDDNVVVGNIFGDPTFYGTGTINDAGTDTVLFYPGSGGATDLDGLTDVDLTGLADDDVLQWNLATGMWEPVDPSTLPGGGADGGLDLTTKGDLHTFDTDQAALPVGANGEVLFADSAAGVGLDWRPIVEADISDLDHNDPSAIHDDVAGEISALTQVTPASTDHILIEDASDANNKKRVAAGDLFGSGTDPDAIHDNVAGEIAAVVQKVTPIAADLLLIEDSADSNNKKRIEIGDLPGGGGGASISTLGSNVPGTVTYITPSSTRRYVRKITVASAGLVLNVNAYLRQTVANVWGGPIRVVLFDDDSGTPGKILGFNEVISINNTVLLNTTAQTPRWVSFPINVPVVAANYWLSIWIVDTADIELGTDATTGAGTGISGYITAGGGWLIEKGATGYGFTATNDEEQLLQAQVLV